MAADPKGIIYSKFFRYLWVGGLVLFTAQFVGLIIWSRFLWDHFDLTTDMASFSQAFSEIGRGHLDPYMSTVAYNYPHYGYSFYQDHFSLIMWPLSLLYTLSHTSFTLLVVQDFALAGTGLIAYSWGLDIISSTDTLKRSESTFIGCGLLLMLIANPWTYWTASFDFHIQPLALFFSLICVRDIWHNKSRVWIWVLLVLLCGDVATTYLVVAGITALSFGRKSRSKGIALLLAALGLFAIVGILHAGNGSHLETDFQYLAHGQVPKGLLGIVVIASGILIHPMTAIRVLQHRFSNISNYVTASGTLGLFSVIGLSGFLFVIATNSLDKYSVFISKLASFQNLAGVLFILIGWVFVARYLLYTIRSHCKPRWTIVTQILVFLALSASIGQVGFESYTYIPQVKPRFAKVLSQSAFQLSRVLAQTTPGSEVVASQGVVGRFANHKWVIPYISAFANGQTIALNRSQTDFILAVNQGIESATPSETEFAIKFLERNGAQLRSYAHGIAFLIYTRKPHQLSITIPNTT